jgi:hypothetical protein
LVAIACAPTRLVYDLEIQQQRVLTGAH